MTDSNAKTILLLALAGLFIGSMLGLLSAGGYATWVRGGDMANIGFGTILAFLPVSWPSSWQVIAEPFRTAAAIGGGVALAGAIRLALCRLEISKARREIKRLQRDLADHPFAEVLIGKWAGWVAPRGYRSLAGAETHLEELEALVMKTRRIVGLAVT